MTPHTSSRWHQSVVAAAMGVWILLAGATPSAGGNLSATVLAPNPFVSPGQAVSIDLTIENQADTPCDLSAVRLTVEHHSGYLQELWVAPAPLHLPPGTAQAMQDQVIWNVPPSAPDGAYFFILHYTGPANTPRRLDAGFVRVLSGPLPAMTYTIDHESCNGLDVFKLRGGMSAEYAVQKSLANLAAGVSHSWYTQSRGRGPDRVYASPQFLEASVHQTVAYYDQHLGENQVYDTVILSTGVTTVPYLSRVTKAPVLPLHFLASAGSVREIRAVLDHSRQRGTDAYAVLGYDASMPSLGVAWIKLLDLPDAYREFLLRHKTRRVLIVGTTGTFGETLARKIRPDLPRQDAAGSIQPDDIFLLYTSSSGLPFPQAMDAAGVFASEVFAADLKQIERRIHDIHQTRFEEGFIRIADWESGVSAEQLDGLAGDLRELGIEATLFSVTPQNDEVLHLYELTTHLVHAFFQKNRDRMSAPDGRLVRGVAVNPYLISQPFYESRNGYLPYLFWQGNDASFLARHAHDLLADCLAADNQSPATLDWWINVTHNFNFYRYPAATFVDHLQRRAGSDLSIRIEPADTDEVWDLTDGINASCERVAQRLLEHATADELKAWDASLQPLTIDDLQQLRQRYPRLVLQPLLAKPD